MFFKVINKEVSVKKSKLEMAEETIKAHKQATIINKEIVDYLNMHGLLNQGVNQVLLNSDIWNIICRHLNQG